MESVVAERLQQSLEYAEAMGIFVPAPANTKCNSAIASELAKHQLLTASVGVAIAAIVMLHNACERFLWRLIRFGLVANRPEVLKWISDRKVTVADVAALESAVVIDAQIEKWWENLERDSLLKKWDKLISLVGFPPKLHDGAWHFDREMLTHFDDVRNNAVHHDGQAVKDFDLVEFAKQIERAQIVWLLHVGPLLNVKIPAEVLFSPVPE